MKKTKAIKRVSAFLFVVVLITAMTIPTLAASEPWPTRMGTWNMQSQGASNGYVQFIQRFLLLYPSTTSEIKASGGVDGGFGAGTAAAVRTYQANNGLSSDGIVGQGTWTSMGRNMGPPNAPQATYFNFYSGLVLHVTYNSSNGLYNHFTYDDSGKEILSYFRQCTY